MTNLVTFPGLNLSLNISKIAFSISGIDIYWYAVLMMSAFLISLIIYRIKNGEYGIKFDDILSLALIVIPISIICARIYYVLFNLDYYTQNPSQIVNFRSGGLAIYGGIIGGVICCYIYCKVKDIDFLDLLDYIVVCLPFGQALGRWGNFINVEAYGSTTNLPWRMRIFENGNYIEVHPTFLYESICTTIIFIILLIKSKNRKFKGELTLIYLMTYSFARMIIEGLRTDSLMLGDIRVSQALSLIIFIFSLCRFLYILVKQKDNRKYN